MAKARGGFDKSYLRQHIGDLFGQRNGRQPQLQEGVNYTLETLTYMTPHKVADDITQIILDRMHPNTPIYIVECCAGIGGNTLSFLENPQVGRVASYEINPERREMLRRNIAAYGLQDKAVVVDEPFAGVHPSGAGAVLYLDPPWLPSGVTGLQAGKDRYILSGMKVGDYTLEQWIQAMPHLAMVVMRVPPGYRLGSVPGWKVETVRLNKSDLILATSPEGMKAAASVAERLRGPPPQATPSEPPAGTKTFQVDVKEQTQWQQDLRVYLQTLLMSFLGNADIVAQLLAPEYMPIWERAFTHETADLNDNYEFYETLGDKMLKSVFAMYITDRLGELSSQAMTEYENRYMSKLYQRELSDLLGLPKYIRVQDSEVTVSLKEDLLEAFVGALVAVTQKARSRGDAFDFSYRFIYYLLQNTDFNPELIYGYPKTQVGQIFSRLGWGDPVETFEQREGPPKSVRFSVSLTPTAVAFMRSKGLKPGGTVLASVVAPTKKGASNQAYEKALQQLFAWGATRDWVDTQRDLIEWSWPEFQPYLPAARARLAREGYTRMYFLTPRYSVTPNSCTVQLVGIQKETERHIRLASISACNTNVGKVEVLKQYAGGN